MQLTIGDFTRQRLITSTATPSLSGANLLKHVSRGIGQLADESIREWQASEISKATAAGKIAGHQENVTYQSGDSLTAQAFNKAAKQSAAIATKVETTLGMNELRNKYNNDPAKYQEESDAYIENQVKTLKENKQTADLAAITEGQMRLAQQSTEYQISKTFMAKAISKMKSDTAILIHTIKAEAFKTAGGIFSIDPIEQGIALNSFAHNKQLLDASLHAVAPDGTPIYTAEAIQKRQQEFHTRFYTTAVQSWISEANLTVKDLVAIRKGTLSIELPGVGKINILDEVGQDAYESKIIKYVKQKMKDKMALDKRIEDQEKIVNKKNKDVADVELITGIYEGKVIDSNSIIKMIKDGKISRVAANSAIRMLNNSEAVAHDEAYETELKVRQIQGEDISKEVIENASRLSAKAYDSLLTANAKAGKTIHSEHEKWIVREMVKKDKFGMDDPMSVRLASDMVDLYRAAIKQGLGPELAMEKARTTIDVMKDRANRRLFSSVPKYSVVKDGVLDIVATLKATKLAVDNGLITNAVYRIEIERLSALINEKKRRKEKKTDE